MLSQACRRLANSRTWLSAHRHQSSCPSYRITELLGDGIGPEIQASVRSVAEAMPVNFEFDEVDWSLDRREKDRTFGFIDEAYESMNRNKLTIKYPTVTKTRSPNALIRRKCEFSVIYRPAISIEGIHSNFRERVDLHIVRIATGGTYEDPGQMLGKDTAVSIRLVERQPCMEAAKFAFELGRKKKMSITSASKHTVQKITDGFFEEVTKKIGEEYRDVDHHVELFDALLGKVILHPQDFGVVLCLNEYGDFLSDLASGLVGSLGTGASGNYSFNPDLSVNIAMFDPAGGTAPDIAGKNVANPTAILLAYGMMLDHIDRYDLGHALRLALLKCIREGDTTRDLGGKLSTTSFTKIVIDRMKELPAIKL